MDNGQPTTDNGQPTTETDNGHRTGQPQTSLESCHGTSLQGMARCKYTRPSFASLPTLTVASDLPDVELSFPQSPLQNVCGISVASDFERFNKFRLGSLKVEVQVQIAMDRTEEAEQVKLDDPPCVEQSASAQQ